MPHSISFFATRHDLVGLLSAAEKEAPLRYCRAGMFEANEQECWDSVLNLPNLGNAPAGDRNLIPFFLIVKEGTPIQVREVPKLRGGVGYAIDQQMNSSSVVFFPGGTFGNALIAGDLGTATNDPTSTDLLNRCDREIRRQFKRIKSYYVGREAEQMLDAGHRLTASTSSPKDCDLSKT